jgi:hypothetical protein
MIQMLSSRRVLVYDFSQREHGINHHLRLGRRENHMREKTVVAVILGALFILCSANPLRAQSASDACSLLTASEVSAALEVKSLPGKPAVEGSPKACVWSDVADASVSNRRVTLSITTSTTAFEYMKSSPRITIETVSGIGDEAFYEISKGGDAPILQVRKGGSVFTLQILSGLKSKPFTLDEVKAKEATLAKAAAGRF